MPKNKALYIRNKTCRVFESFRKVLTNAKHFNTLCNSAAAAFAENLYRPFLDFSLGPNCSFLISNGRMSSGRR